MSKRPLRQLAVTAVAVGALLAGCGHGDARTPEVATAGQTPTAAAAKTSAAAQSDDVTAYLESARAFARCLRAAGFNVSDPNGKGQVTNLGAPKAGTDLRAGRDKCTKLLPPMPAELKERPARTRAQIEVARRYAKCMRANGAPDFPDPDANGEFTSSDATSVWDQDTAGAHKAVQTCTPIVGGGSDNSQGVG